MSMNSSQWSDKARAFWRALRRRNLELLAVAGLCLVRPAFAQNPVVFSLPDSLTGAAGDTIVAAVALQTGGNQVAFLGAAITADPELLTFVDYTIGPIAPAAGFSLSAPASDSVRMAYFDAGSGPISSDGVLVRLRFVVSANVAEGDSATLRFSDLSAGDPLANALPVAKEDGLFRVPFSPVTISGAKWNDLDGDAVWDEEEPGLAGWEIRLIAAGSDDTLQTTTDATGAFQFSQITHGSYRVTEAAQPGWLQTYPPTFHYDISLAPGETADSLFFGNWQTAELGGLIWEDADSSGAREAGEAPLPGWSVWLAGTTATGVTLADTAFADSLGRYLFAALEPGNYTVGVVPDSSYRLVFPASGSYTVELISAARVADLDFGAMRNIATAVRGGAPPVAFDLKQNYPNPFNPVTTIRYSVATHSLVRLEILDVLGRRVRLLVDERQQAGHYSVEFDAAGLASGVYFSRLTAAPGVVLLQKLILSK